MKRNSSGHDVMDLNERFGNIIVGANLLVFVMEQMWSKKAELIRARQNEASKDRV